MRARALALLAVLGLAACEGDPPPADVQASPSFSPEGGVLRLVGTGAMVPLAWELAGAFARSRTDLRIVVEPSVGSGGGVRAASDGAVDLGMVSRPVTDGERRRGLAVFPVARDVVVLAAHRAVPVDALATAEVLALVKGGQTSFPDGTAATVLLRDRQESANVALDRAVEGLDKARDEATRTRRWRVLYHDDSMGEALAATPGALGVFNLGAIITGRLPLKVLAIDGTAPSVAAVESGAWRATRELSFVAREDRVGRARGFLDFVATPEAHALIRACGYLPLANGATP